MTWQRLWRNPRLRWTATAVLLLGLVVTGRLWVPALLACAPLLDSYSDRLQGFAALVQLGLILFSLLALVRGWLGLRRPGSGRSLLVAQNVVDEIKLCTDRGQTPWTPRTPDSARFLANHSRFVFRDGAGAGKTREALELIRCHAGRPVRLLVAPNWGAQFDSCVPDALEAALDTLPIGGGPVVLWLDDLHLHNERHACDRVSELISILERRLPSDRLFVVGTMRDEVSLDTWSKCFDQHRIVAMGLDQMEREAFDALAADMAHASGIALTDPVYDAMWQFDDHRPELLRSAFGRLKQDGETQPAPGKVLATLARGLSDLWQKERVALIHGEPSIEPLLVALELFYAARQYPHVGLVRALARSHIKGILSRSDRHLRRAERALQQHRYFAVVGDSWRASEIALDRGQDSIEALDALEQFLRRYRKLLRLWPFRTFEGLREPKTWLAIGLGHRYEEAGHHDCACRMYALAVSISPTSHGALMLWGGVLEEKAVLLAGQELVRESLAAHDAAGERYQQALTIRPDSHQALFLWGISLERKGSLLATCDRVQEALDTYDAAGAHYRQALEIRPDLHDAYVSCGMTLANKGNLLAKEDRGQEALDSYIAAEECYQAALDIKPDLHAALVSWGNVLVAKADLFAIQARIDEALNTYDDAGTRYWQALALKHDKHEAFYFWGHALTRKAVLLAKLGQIGQVLDTYCAAGVWYRQALAIAPDKYRHHYSIFVDINPLVLLQVASDRSPEDPRTLGAVDDPSAVMSKLRWFLAWRHYGRWYLRMCEDDEQTAAIDLHSALVVAREALDHAESEGLPEPSGLFAFGLYLLADRKEHAALDRYREGLALQPPAKEVARAQMELFALAALIGEEAVLEAMRLLGDGELDGGSSPNAACAPVAE